MAEQTLLASAAFSVVAATVYGYVGWRLGQRRVSEDAALASRAFSVWWYALGALTFVGGALSLAAAFGFASLQVSLTFTYVALLGLCVGLWGLLYYLLYLFTGKRALWKPLAGFYAVVAVVIVWAVTNANPIAVQVNRWNVGLQYETPITGAPQWILLGTILVPQLLSGFAYLTVYFRVKDPTLKYRIAVVSLAIIVWFGSSLVASATGVNQNDTWQLVSRAIGLAAAFAILLAYHPPPILRQRLGIRAITEEAAPADTLGAPEAPRGMSLPALA